MLPRITDPNAWEQAELLMQPAFIRVVDNIRKQLDDSAWKGTYHDVLIWPANATEETKAVVNYLLQEMENAAPERLEEIKATLASLPIPQPGYHLQLQHQELKISVDLWDLCYQVCFLNYSPENTTVEIDTSLMDESGDVDWQRLETKTKEIVKQVFDSLPEN